MSLNLVCTCVLWQSTDYVSSCHMHHTNHFTPTIVYFLSQPTRVHRWRSVVSLSYCLVQDGLSAFEACVVGGHLAVAEYLVPKMEGHLFDSDGDGYTALHWAAQDGQLSMVEYLVRFCGFDVKARDMVGIHCLLFV